MDKSISNNNQLNTDHEIGNDNNSICSNLEKSEINNINSEDNVSETIDFHIDAEPNLDNISNNNNINNEDVVKPTEIININEVYDNDASANLQNHIVNPTNAGDNVIDIESIKINESCDEMTCTNLVDTNNNNIDNKDDVNCSEIVNINDDIDNNSNRNIQNSVNSINNKDEDNLIEIFINTNKEYDNNASTELQNPIFNNINTEDNIADTEAIKSNESCVEMTCSNLDDINNNEDVVVNGSETVNKKYEDIDNNSNSNIQNSVNNINNEDNLKETVSVTINLTEAYDNKTTSGNTTNETDSLNILYHNINDNNSIKMSLLHDDKSSSDLTNSSLKFTSSEMEKECPLRGLCDLICLREESSFSDFDSENSKLSSVKNPSDLEIIEHFVKTKMYKSESSETNRLITKVRQNSNCSCNSVDNNNDIENQIKFENKGITLCFCKLSITEIMEKFTKLLDKKKNININRKSDEIISESNNPEDILYAAGQNSSLANEFAKNLETIKTSSKISYQSRKSTAAHISNNNVVPVKSIPIKQLISVETQTLSVSDAKIIADDSDANFNKKKLHNNSSENNVRNNNKILENCEDQQLKSVVTQTSNDTSTSTTSHISESNGEILSIIKQILIENVNDLQLKSVATQIALKLLSVATQTSSSNIFELKYNGSNSTTSNSDNSEDFYSINSQNCKNIDEISSTPVTERVLLENYNNHRLKSVATQSIDQKLISIATQISDDIISETSHIRQCDGEILSIIKQVLIEKFDDDVDDHYNQLKSIATQLISKLIYVATQIPNSDISALKYHSSNTTMSNSDENSEDFYSLNSQDCKNIDDEKISSASVTERVSIENYNDNHLKSVETQVSMDKYIIYVANEISKLNASNSDDVTMSDKKIKTIRKISPDKISKTNSESTQQFTDAYPKLLSVAKGIIDNINVNSNERQSTDRLLNVEQQIIIDDKTINNTKETQLTVRNSLTEEDDINNNQTNIEKTSSNHDDDISIIYQTSLKPPISLQSNGVVPPKDVVEPPNDETPSPQYNLRSTESFYNLLHNNEQLQCSTELLHNFIEYLKLESIEKLPLNEKQKKLNIDKNSTEILNKNCLSSQKISSLTISTTAMNPVSTIITRHPLESSPAAKSVDSINITISELKKFPTGTVDTINNNSSMNTTTVAANKCVLCYKLEQQILETNNIELIKYVFQKLPDCTCKYNMNDLQSDIGI